MKPGTVLRYLVMAAAGTWALGPAWAQYKVVQPDGSVVYTDRPPAPSAARVTSVGPSRATGARAAAPSAAEALAAGLPTELRTAVLRYPVTLYSGTDCSPCDSGRRLLQQRGVPFLERQVLNDDDVAALQKLMGVRTVPALSIGTQPLRGYTEGDWHNFLDAAGYPRETRLPKGWKGADVTPLAARTAPAAAAAADEGPRVAPRAATLEPPPPPASGSLRF